MDVELLLRWAYGRQLVDSGGSVLRDDWEPSSSSTDGVAAVERIGLLGCRVDTFGPTPWDVHPDAETIHSVASQAGGLCMKYARLGMRPDWLPDARLLAVPRARNTRGAPEMLYDPVSHRPYYCEIIFVNLPEEIAAAHRRYSRWHEALCHIRDEVNRIGLRRYVASGPEAAPEPWSDHHIEGLRRAVNARA